MWQQCPQCKGSGKNYHGLMSDKTSVICDVCNGHKIINSLTGLPPTKELNIRSDNFGKTNFNNTDFRDANKESQQEYFGK